MFWMGWGSHWYAWSSWQSIATLYWSILSSPWWFVTRDGKPLPTKLLMCLSYTTYRYISLLTCPPFSFSLGNPRCIRWGFGWCTWIIRQRRGASWCLMGLGSSGWIWVPFHVELGKKKLPSRPPVRTSIYIIYIYIHLKSVSSACSYNICPSTFLCWGKTISKAGKKQFTGEKNALKRTQSSP